MRYFFLDRVAHLHYMEAVSRDCRKALSENPDALFDNDEDTRSQRGRYAPCFAPVGRWRVRAARHRAERRCFWRSTMSQSTNSSRFLQDFEGRKVTAIAIIVAAFGSATLNVYGASQMFPALLTSIVFGTVIASGEVIAALSLRHIVADYENNRFWKARLSSVILALAITGCVLSGHKAFSTLFLEADANHTALQARADAAQEVADEYKAVFVADDSEINLARYESRQKTADQKALEALKSAPPPEGIIYILLALFELVKIGGLYALATPSTKGLTKPQRRAQKRQQKLRDKKAIADFERKLADLDDADDNVFPLRA